MARIAALLAALALLVPSAAAANLADSPYEGKTFPGENDIHFHLSGGFVHHFKMNGHTLVERMTVTNRYFDGHTKSGRYVYGHFRDDGHALGHITDIHGRENVYGFHVKPKHG